MPEKSGQCHPTMDGGKIRTNRTSTNNQVSFYISSDPHHDFNKITEAIKPCNQREKLF